VDLHDGDDHSLPIVVGRPDLVKPQDLKSNISSETCCLTSMLSLTICKHNTFYGYAGKSGLSQALIRTYARRWVLAQGRPHWPLLSPTTAADKKIAIARKKDQLNALITGLAMCHMTKVMHTYITIPLIRLSHTLVSWAWHMLG
jgi:hypothetical protein